MTANTEPSAVARLARVRRLAGACETMMRNGFDPDLSLALDLLAEIEGALLEQHARQPARAAA